MNRDENILDLSLIALTSEELEDINGGAFPLFLAIGGAAAAGLAIYEGGKAVGEMLYYAIN